jgi:cell division septal protein FtsQ
VSGAKILSADEIKALSGIPLNENLFFANFSRAENNLRKIGAIKTFKIRRFPPATVIIAINERLPMAAVIFPDQSIIIDSDGYIINQNPNLTLNIPNMIDLPIIAGVDQNELLKNNQIDQKTVGTISSIIQRLSRFTELKKLQFNLGGLEEMELLLDDILKVKLGDVEELETKMKTFEKLIARVSGKWSQIEYLDVRYPNEPVIKFK